MEIKVKAFVADDNGESITDRIKGKESGKVVLKPGSIVQCYPCFKTPSGNTIGSELEVSIDTFDGGEVFIASSPYTAECEYHEKHGAIIKTLNDYAFAENLGALGGAAFAVSETIENLSNAKLEFNYFGKDERARKWWVMFRVVR